MTPGGIVVAGLHRRFGPVVALQGVDLEVPPGQIVALLGENGAGKTTLIRVLSNVLVPDAGRVSVAGHDLGSEPRAARARTGVVLGEERSFFWRLSGAANLEFFAALQGLRRSVARHRVEEVLAMVELSEVAGRRVDRYSSGMRARLGLARGLLGSPA
ncbi:MAG: ABC transporter ATP-binding protein, partial [Acidimicrobiales bacterium]